MPSARATAAMSARTVNRPPIRRPSPIARPVSTSITTESQPHSVTSTPCACGGSCPTCTTSAASASPALTDVRVHPSAPDVTTPLNARAVTVGRDIYFHPGQFRPNTPEGDQLIAHELAHTVQSHRSDSTSAEEATAVSQPDDALEENADALAAGETDHVLDAPAGAALLSPFDNEPAADRTRRLELLQAVQNAEANLIRLLQTGGLVRTDEVAAERGGVRGVVVPANTLGTADEHFESYTARDARLRRIVRSLIALSRRYRTETLPATLPPSTVSPDDGSFGTTIATPEGSSTYSGLTAPWAQLQAAYELYRIERGQTGTAYEVDWYYLEPNLTVIPGAARGAPRASRGIASGAYMVFPDIDGDPMNYWRLDGYSATPRGSVIVEFWHDDFGYYYTHKGQRIDVPNPWRSGGGS